MDRGKDREIDYQLPPQAKQAWLGEVNLLPINTYIFTYWLLGIEKQKLKKKKETKIKTPWENKSPPHFTRFNFTLSCQMTLLSPDAPHYDAGCTQSFQVRQKAVGAGACHGQYTAVSLCCFFFLTTFCCSSMAPQWAAGVFLCHGIFSSSDLSVPSVLSHSFDSLLLYLSGIFCALLKYVSSEVPWASMMGSAVSCSGSIVKPAMSGMRQVLASSHGGFPSSPSPGALTSPKPGHIHQIKYYSILSILQSFSYYRKWALAQPLLLMHGYKKGQDVWMQQNATWTTSESDSHKNKRRSPKRQPLCQWSLED